MAANSYPALNDVMYSELVILTEKVADLCPEIRRVSLYILNSWWSYTVAILLHGKLFSALYVALLWKIYLKLKFFPQIYFLAFPLSSISQSPLFPSTSYPLVPLLSSHTPSPAPQPQIHLHDSWIQTRNLHFSLFFELGLHIRKSG